MPEYSESSIPVLTDVVADVDDAAAYPSAADMLIAELQTRLAADTFALTEELMRAAFAEMEAHLFQQISARLREALPEMIDAVLRDYLSTDDMDAKG